MIIPTTAVFWNWIKRNTKMKKRSLLVLFLPSFIPTIWYFQEKVSGGTNRTVWMEEQKAPRLTTPILESVMPELLEIIFSFLSVQDVASCCRVCQIQEFIFLAGSPRLFSFYIVLFYLLLRAWRHSKYKSGGNWVLNLEWPSYAITSGFAPFARRNLNTSWGTLRNTDSEEQKAVREWEGERKREKERERERGREGERGRERGEGEKERERKRERLYQHNQAHCNFCEKNMWMRLWLHSH